MEVTLTAEPTVTATTPAVETAVIPQVVTTPDATMATEAVVPAPETTPDYFLQAETGTVYKDRTAAEQGIAEKDRYIEILRQQNQLLANQMQQAPQQAQVQPNPVAEVAARLEQQYLSDPDNQGVDPATLKHLAKLNAVGVVEAQKEAFRTTQLATDRMRHEAFVDAHPELTDAVGQEVYRRQVQMTGQPFDSPQQHLQAVYAELYMRSKSQPQTNVAAAAVAAHGAMNGQRTTFANPGTGTPPAQAPVNSYVANALAEAQRRGITDPAELARIQSIAAGVTPASFGIRR